MIVIRSLIMAFSCFSAIPMPTIEWDEYNMRYLMAAFPLVGVAIGASVLIWQLVCSTLGFGPVLTGAGYTLIPILISGGIHLDGFADVVDAQSSHAEPARKREILKDPHIGAFAAMGTCCYLIAYFALTCELEERHLLLLACMPVISRCLSAFATVTFRSASKSGMLAAEQSTASAKVVRAVVAALFCLASGIMLSRDVFVTTVTLIVAVVTLLLVRRLAEREYGGMSGDLAGFFLQIAELAMLACVVIVGRMV